MNYGDLIKDAFRTTVRNRYLWFFGFFAGGGTGGCGLNAPSGGGFDDGDFERSGAGFPALAQIGPEGTALIVALVTLAVMILVAFVILHLVSQGGLARSVAAIDRGEGSRFSETWQAGLSRFWRVLGYYVVFFLIALGLLAVIGLLLVLPVAGVFAGTESVAARVLVVVFAALAGITLLIGVFIPLTIIGQFALREIAIRDSGVLASVAGGYGVFRSNAGRSFLVWLIQLGLMLGIGIALLIATLLVGLLLFLPTIVLVAYEYTTAAIVAGLIAVLVLLPLLILASAIAGTFNHAYWTIAYLRLTIPPETASL
ncbi:MAG: hypothetical protein AB1425_12365 [Actinomycetota bacterium]